MTKLFLFFLVACFACNNSSDATISKWTKEDENKFLSDCIENAKVQYSEDTAYSLCHCVLGKVKVQFPTADSADAGLDSARAAEFTKECQ